MLKERPGGDGGDAVLSRLILRVVYITAQPALMIPIPVSIGTLPHMQKIARHVNAVEAAGGDTFRAPAFTSFGCPFPSALRFFREIAHSGGCVMAARNERSSPVRLASARFRRGHPVLARPLLSNVSGEAIVPDTMMAWFLVNGFRLKK